MDRPSWEQKTSEREQETRELIRKQGERESFQQSVNFLDGDYLGLEDGRPGIGISPGIGGWVVTMPLHWQIIMGVAGLILIALLAFGTRACIGEERAQQILNEQASATSPVGNTVSGQ